ncbi:MAG: class I SAM-dependent methyltransferase [Candidatus Thorarchaeota archaeon]
MDEDENIRLVRSGYDKIASRYHAERVAFDISVILQSFIETVRPGGHVLDAGCGAGVPVARTLVDSGFQVTGIDISESMLKLARSHVPEAVFVLQDMTKLSFDEGEFDGAISAFALIHVPRTLHSEVLRHFFRVLRSGGVLLVSLGLDEWEDVDGYFGHPMYWSHHDKETSHGLVTEAGFRIVWDRVVETRGEKHYWILAMKD